MGIDRGRWTKELALCADLARGLAVAQEHDKVGVASLLFAVTLVRRTVATYALDESLSKAGIDLPSLQAVLISAMTDVPPGPVRSKAAWSTLLEQHFHEAVTVCGELGHRYTGPEHIFIAALRVRGSSIGSHMLGLGLSEDLFTRAVERVLSGALGHLECRAPSRFGSAFDRLVANGWRAISGRDAE